MLGGRKGAGWRLGTAAARTLRRRNARKQAVGGYPVFSGAKALRAALILGAYTYFLTEAKEKLLLDSSSRCSHPFKQNASRTTRINWPPPERVLPPSPRRLRGDRSRNATPRNLCHISPFGSSNGGRNGGEEKGDEEEAAARNSAAKRELIAPRGNKRYVRRGAKGRWDRI
jgi:hypothetical protein